MTQLELAKAGKISPQMETVARIEGVEPDVIRRGMADGVIVIPANPNHYSLVPCGIGRGLRTKINANIGTSSDYGDIRSEMIKLLAVIKYQADAVMDLSTGGDIGAVRAVLSKPVLFLSELYRSTRQGSVLSASMVRL